MKNSQSVAKVILSHKDGVHVNVHKYLTKIVDRPNGRYMIKSQSLKYRGTYFYGAYIAFRKTYFIACDGISFAVNDKKRKDIFYTNNWTVACNLAKMLSACAYSDELISIVDRKLNGIETYVLNKAQQRSNNVIYVK